MSAVELLAPHTLCMADDPTVDDQIAQGLAEARRESARAGGHSHAGSWTILAGVVIAAIGGIVLGLGKSHEGGAARSAEFARALYGFDGVGPEMRAAMTQSAIGLGVLIFGGALLLLGIALKAFGR